MLRRRLTALFASLVFLPSVLAAGGNRCVMDALVPARGSAVAPSNGHGAHKHEHDAPASAQHAHSHDALGDTDAGSSRDAPHAPTQCTVTVGCGGAVIATADTSVESSLQVAGAVEPTRVLAPDSPAPGLEPPPPRA